MNLMLFVILLILFITIMLMFIIMIIKKKTITTSQKTTPFECGFNPMSYSRLPFSMHFFMIAVIFLIFDIEIIMIMPIIFTMKTSMYMYWILTSVTFTSILLVGLFHEWKNGMINWTK
uniref:NADH-ubiquinone oxidoreductase chain 3 n=1 Tax=Japananus hyalinus TaxID=1256066 RepID=A0A343BSX2_9HEMI|nr:NADH dehydrogenase subunit 3 [Japananus hyalinus]ARA90993.1 NADH dehydrogenase subunit 3 [Japananus hyalinus]